MKINIFFTLRGKLDNKIKTILEFSGFIFLLFIWWYLAKYIYTDAILPTPYQVLSSYKEMYLSTKDALIDNILYSLKLNFLGYFEAICIAIPIGFIIGLFPIFKTMFNRHIDAIRFLPLTAITGLFIAWFGIELNMKVQFLAFGIFVYLLPVVIQRIYEVQEVYVQTLYTLGANKWNIIRRVFIPAVISKLSDDIRVLVAISWTYIIVAELVNKSGGIGALIFTTARQSRLDKVFAILFLIIMIGVIQDKIFIFLDKKIFKHKYAVTI